MKASKRYARIFVQKLSPRKERKTERVSGSLGTSPSSLRFFASLLFSYRFFRPKKRSSCSVPFSPRKSIIKLIKPWLAQEEKVGKRELQRTGREGHLAENMGTFGKVNLLCNKIPLKIHVLSWINVWYEMNLEHVNRLYLFLLLLHQYQKN